MPPSTPELLDRLSPREKRLIVTVPQAGGRDGITKTSSGLLMPEQAERTRRTWGEVCTVIKVGIGCDRILQPGVQVVISEWAGDIIRDPEANQATEICIIGEGDIMAVLL